MTLLMALAVLFLIELTLATVFALVLVYKVFIGTIKL